MVGNIRKLLSFFLIAMYLLAGFGEQAHAVVLCFGDDGHAVLEREAGGRCAPSSIAEHSPDFEARPGNGKIMIKGGTADSCLDYCISSTCDSIRKHQDLSDLSDLASIGSATVAQFVYPVSDILHPKLSLSDIPPPYRAAVALRSIVLLI